jgi:CRP-like cAMP-binding protein
LNVEHRTSNIERPIFVALRFIYFLNQADPSLQGAQSSQISNGDSFVQRTRRAHAARALVLQGRVTQRVAQYFYKLTEYNIRCSTFVSFFSDQTARFSARRRG